MTQLSYVHGASDTPFIGHTIGVHFDRVVERFPDRVALIVRHQQVRWTYRELKDRIDAFDAGLLALGLERGDRIGVWSPNNAEWVITQFATAKAGLIHLTHAALKPWHEDDAVPENFDDGQVDLLHVACGYCGLEPRVSDVSGPVLGAVMRLWP